MGRHFSRIHDMDELPVFPKKYPNTANLGLNSMSTNQLVFYLSHLETDILNIIEMPCKG